MKLAVGILFACIVGTYGQSGVVLEGLMQSQSELALTHEFFETLMAMNRGQLSSYIYRVSRFVLLSHFDTYAIIMTTGTAARAEIEALEPQNPGEEECLSRFFRRFDLQKQRFGQALARCIGNVDSILGSWNSFANDAHETAQDYSSQIQNMGVNLFARTSIFDGPEDFPAMINRELWNSITRVMDFIESVEEFIRNISINIDEIQIDFINCDRELEDRVAIDIEVEVSRARVCLGGGGGVDPEPTH